MKKIMTPIYNTEEEIVLKEVTFPLKKTIDVDVDYLTGLWLYTENVNWRFYQIFAIFPICYDEFPDSQQGFIDKLWTIGYSYGKYGGL